MRLAYVLERYPELTQTFVEAELRELVRAGDEAEVLALQPGDGAELAQPAFEPSYPARGAARVAALAGAAARSPREAAAFVRGGAGRPGGARGASGTASQSGAARASGATGADGAAGASSAAGGSRAAGAEAPFPAAVARLAERWPPGGSRVRALARIAGWRAAAGRADHLHAHFATEAADIAALLGALTGTPHSFTGHSTDLFAQPEALRHRLHAAAFAVVICDYDRREVEKIAPGAGRLHVVPLGLDLDAIKRTTPYDADGPVVAVGRLVEYKGFADLAAVASSLGREVVIAGDGPRRSELEALANGAVEFRGALSPDESRRLIESASILVAPSVVASDGSRDGIPMVIKEALALATPVVASDAVGNPEVVDTHRGALYRAGERGELKEAVRAVLARPDREALGKAGRAFAEREADVRTQTARLRELFRPR